MSDKPQLYDVGGVMLPQPFRAGRLGHLGLYIDDLDQACDFFGNVLGFRKTDIGALPHPGATPRSHFFSHCTDHHALALISADIGRSRDPRYGNGITVNQISFQVRTLEEVIAAYEYFVGKGYEIWRVGRDRPGSNYAVYFRDPDGFNIEVFYGMEQIGWDGRSKPIARFAHLSQAIAPELPRPSEQTEVMEAEAQGMQVTEGFLVRDNGTPAYDVGGIMLPRPFKVVGLGPITLFVKDVDASIGFYRDLMGLEVTQEIDVRGRRCVFLRVGTEHHTLTLVPVSLRDELGLSPKTTLAFMGLQVPTYRQLRDARQYMLDKGYREIEVPGELHCGIDIAAHFEGPEGHVVQLYFDMERVGWDGRTRPMETREFARPSWPEVIPPKSDTYRDLRFTGPLG